MIEVEFYPAVQGKLLDCLKLSRDMNRSIYLFKRSFWLPCAELIEGRTSPEAGTPARALLIGTGGWWNEDRRMQGSPRYCFKEEDSVCGKDYVLGPGREGGVEKAHGCLAKPSEASL